METFSLSLDEIHREMEEFSRPVESIMRCQDFKSNFARKLSNRYISRSPVSSLKQDTALKLQAFDSNADENVPDHVPETMELVTQLSKTVNMEQIGKTMKTPDKTNLKNSNLHCTEATVLNMEVETLRWQLTQTEANRQMHIALLKQIVAFLNRVKEHIESQNEMNKTKTTIVPGRLSTSSFSTADLPRSLSVVHVNRNIEITTNSAKKINTRKISKSISNVNGFMDCSKFWSQSKISLTSNNETSQKISEEMSRLINLANTVLSTNLPELSSTCNDNATNMVTSSFKVDDSTLNDDVKKSKDSAVALTLIEEDSTFEMHGTQMSELQRHYFDKFPIKPPNLGKSDDDEINIKINEVNYSAPRAESEKNTTRKITIDRKNDFNSSQFMEDESGFSSMSSFQDIGIPIISIIPPSPCKEVGYMVDMPDIIEDSEKWKTDTIELGKQPVKVFWV